MSECKSTLKLGPRDTNPLSPKYKLPTFIPQPSEEPKFIRDAMDVKDIEGTKPRPPKERNKLYNAIDYTDVNGSKRKFLIRRESEVIGDKGGLPIGSLTDRDNGKYGKSNGKIQKLAKEVPLKDMHTFSESKKGASLVKNEKLKNTKSMNKTDRTTTVIKDRKQLVKRSKEVELHTYRTPVKANDKINNKHRKVVNKKRSNTPEIIEQNPYKTPVKKAKKKQWLESTEDDSTYNNAFSEEKLTGKKCEERQNTDIDQEQENMLKKMILPDEHYQSFKDHAVQKPFHVREKKDLMEISKKPPIKLVPRVNKNVTVSTAKKVVQKDSTRTPVIKRIKPKIAKSTCNSPKRIQIDTSQKTSLNKSCTLDDFRYIPKSVVSKPLMRRCGGPVMLTYYSTHPNKPNFVIQPIKTLACSSKQTSINNVMQVFCVQSQVQEQSPQSFQILHYFSSAELSIAEHPVNKSYGYLFYSVSQILRPHNSLHLEHVAS
eukprot:TRINITY_DN1630_c0_g1_i1.p1 TRINITY_DN1630_c0_g1~~TRINITY_DN1630_c0_g1_i1.p1  ORF type:complete len:486 (-),score=43.75 TRINITY_DN1630_c0_g1_i1:3806-5263(-)